MHPQDIRPMNLIEASNKLFCTLLLSRLVVHWPAPFVQCGGLQGGQVADALAAANWQVYSESIADVNRVWLSADIKSASDSIQHDAVASFIREYSPPSVAREALQLLRIVCKLCLRSLWVTLSRMSLSSGSLLINPTS